MATDYAADNPNLTGGAFELNGFMYVPSGDSTYGLFPSELIIGGQQEFITLDDRDAIPIKTDGVTNGQAIGPDGISSGRRKIGMVVIVVDPNGDSSVEPKHYMLLPYGFFGNGGTNGLTEWNALPDVDKIVLLDPTASVTYFDPNAPGGPGNVTVTGSGDPEECWFELVHPIELPAGGSAGQVLTKTDNIDYNVQWSDPQGGSGNGEAGAQGAQGAEGAAGPQGAQGAVGTGGSTGPQGAQGATGAGETGAQGPIGPTGAQGLPGAVAAAGAQGAQGAQGFTGAQGAAGAQGATGAQGVPGNLGPTGAQGAAGPQGPIGPTGPQGVPGAASTIAGPQGAQGATGAQGLPGAVAAAGAQGAQGAQGDDGAAGPQGAQGATGTGEAGPQGAQGAGGVAGPQGAQGAGGVAGPQGAQGATGTGEAGPQGAQGATGTGEAGPQGAQGAQGPAGSGGGGSGVYFMKVAFLNGVIDAGGVLVAEAPDGTDLLNDPNWTITPTIGGSNISLTHNIAKFGNNFEVHAELSPGRYITKAISGSNQNANSVVQVGGSIIEFNALAAQAGISSTTTIAYLTWTFAENDFFV